VSVLSNILLGTAMVAGIATLVVYVLWLAVEVHNNYRNIYGGDRDLNDRD
jgi:hypothetical protein